MHLFQSNGILAIIITTSAAFVVGLIDDRKVMGGWFKPVALAISAIPIILFGAYDSDLAFPLFGDVQIPALYFAIIIVMIPITGNTINSIDVLNGVASGFMTIASFALTISLFIIQNYEIAIVSLPLAFVSLAFYKFHKFPKQNISRRFWCINSWSNVWRNCNCWWCRNHCSCCITPSSNQFIFVLI